MADIRFDGKVAIVTGAGGGLGRQHALELARRGAKVVVNDLGGSVDGSGGSSAAAEAVVAEIKAFGGEAIANGGSVTDDAGVAHMVQQTLDAWGRIDILVANAGINHRAPITEFSLSDFRRVMDTNLTSVWVLCKAAARHMQPKRCGRIILTGSISAINARATVSAYVASKGAVHSLTKQLAVELASANVTVNCIAPGFFATEMNTPLLQNQAFTDWVKHRTPAGRWGALQEIGPAAVFLASDEASYVNGLILTVDGGFTAAM